MDGFGLLPAQQWLLKWEQLLVPAITHYTVSFIILDVYFLNLTLSYLTCNSLFSVCF